MSTHKSCGCGCKSCGCRQQSCNYHVVRREACNIGGQEVIIVTVSDEEQNCCTDNWAFYPHNYNQQRHVRKCCKFNSCHKGCCGGKY